MRRNMPEQETELTVVETVGAAAAADEEAAVPGVDPWQSRSRGGHAATL